MLAELGGMLKIIMLLGKITIYYIEEIGFY